MLARDSALMAVDYYRDGLVNVVLEQKRFVLS